MPLRKRSMVAQPRATITITKSTLYIGLALVAAVCYVAG